MAIFKSKASKDNDLSDSSVSNAIDPEGNVKGPLDDSKVPFLTVRTVFMTICTGKSSQGAPLDCCEPVSANTVAQRWEASSLVMTLVKSPDSWRWMSSSPALANSTPMAPTTSPMCARD